MKTAIVNPRVLPGLTDKTCLLSVSTGVLVKVVIEQSCAHFEVSLAQFHFRDKKSKARKSPGATTEVAAARHLYCYLMKIFYRPKLSLKKIGSYIYEGFDHTSVINGVKRIKDDLDTGRFSKHHLSTLTQFIDNKIFTSWSSVFLGTQAAVKTQLENSFVTSSLKSPARSVLRASLSPG